MLGALKSENLIAFFCGNYDGIDFAGTDGAECFLKLVDALLQVVEDRRLR
jgi:hypothetical protein